MCDTTPFSPEALAENHSGHLTDDQARRFQFMVSARRKGTRSLALPVGAIGVLLLLLNGPAATAGKRHLTGWGFVAAAAALLAAPAFDPLKADVHDRRVETIQGAIGKRRVQTRGGPGFTMLLSSRRGSPASGVSFGLRCGSRRRLCARVLSASYAAAGQSRTVAESATSVRS